MCPRNRAMVLLPRDERATIITQEAAPTHATTPNIMKNIFHPLEVLGGESVKRFLTLMNLSDFEISFLKVFIIYLYGELLSLHTGTSVKALRSHSIPHFPPNS